MTGKTREQLSETMAEALTNAGVPPMKVQRCVQAIMATLATEAIEDAIAQMVDKRVNVMKPQIDTIVENKLAVSVKRHFSEDKIKALVVKEAQRQAEKLYEFMFNNGGKK